MRSVLALLVFFGAAQASDAPDPEALERLVVQDCGSCHGLTLKGGLGPDIRPKSLQHYDPEILKDVILDCIPDTPMPPWRFSFSPEEASWMVQRLKQGVPGRPSRIASTSASSGLSARLHGKSGGPKPPLMVRPWQEPQS